MIEVDMSLKFNKNEEYSLRPEILDLPSIMSVADYMSKKGWDLELKMPEINKRNTGSGFVSFKKRDNWHDRLVPALHHGYGKRLESVNLSEEEILLTTKKAAEICLRVYEHFGNTYPTSPNIYGEISACTIGNKEEYLQDIFRYENRVELANKRWEVKLAYKPSNDSVVVTPNNILIEASDLALLNKNYKMVKEAFSGEIAIRH